MERSALQHYKFHVCRAKLFRNVCGGAQSFAYVDVHSTAIYPTGFSGLV